MHAVCRWPTRQYTVSDWSRWYHYPVSQRAHRTLAVIIFPQVLLFPVFLLARITIFHALASPLVSRLTLFLSRSAHLKKKIHICVSRTETFLFAILWHNKWAKIYLKLKTKVASEIYRTNGSASTLTGLWRFCMFSLRGNLWCPEKLRAIYCCLKLAFWISYTCWTILTFFILHYKSKCFIQPAVQYN